MNPKCILRACAVFALAAPLLGQDWFAPMRKSVIPPLPSGDPWRPFAVADFDGDGVAEILARAGFGATALLVRGADGRFVDRSATRLPVPIAGGAVADLDGDGWLDLVGPPVLRNDGSGGFVDVTATHMPGVTPFTMARLAFDADGDGDVDVLTRSGVGTQLWVNDGTGRLAAASGAAPPPSGDGHDAFGDVDGDGLVDVVVGGRLWRNLGGLRFEDVTATRLPAVALYCQAAVLADLEGDGDLDLIQAAGEATGGGHLYLVNDGRGWFTDATLPRWPDRPFGPIGAFAVADFDGDGDLDVACGVYVPGSDLAGEDDPGRDLLYLNDGSGTLVEATAGRMMPDAAQTHEMFAADLDGDGDADLVSGHVPYVVDSGMAVHVNDGRARFVEVAQPWSVHLSGIEDTVAFGDVEGDGVPDAVGASGDGWRLRRGRGDGSFDAEPLTAGRFASAVTCFMKPTLADLDGDGDLDLITVGVGAAWHANAPMAGGERGFAAGTHPLPLPAWTHPRAVLAVDLDADGDLDLLVEDFDSTFVLANDGAGNFTDVTPPGPLTSRHSLAVTDVDRDGVPDLLVASNDGFGPRMRVLIHDGRFRFVDGTATRWPSAALAVEFPVVADVDGDGDEDVFVAEPVGPSQWLARLMVHDGVGAFVDETATRLPVERPRVFDILDVDGDGRPEATAADPVARRCWTLWNDGAGVFMLGDDVVPGTPLVDLDGDGDIDLQVPARYRTDLAFARARQLSCPTVPRIGERLELRVEVRTRGAALTIALPVVSLPTAPVTVAGLGRVWLDPAVLLPLPWMALSGAAATAALPIPNDPAVVGVELAAQALLLTPGGPRPLALTGPVFEMVRN